MRIAAQIAYNGTTFHGWQIQKNAPSVQEAIQKVLSTLAQQEISVVGCGRTDTGVHAYEYYFHADMEWKQGFLRRVNTMLPSSIVVKNVYHVSEDFHARFDASRRTYTYRVSRAKKPFAQNQTYYWRVPVDVENMNRAGRLLIGTQDFKCFSKEGSQVNTYICTVEEALWEVVEDELVFTISANRFLRNMVRAVVGTLLDVGEGKTTFADVEKILASRDRRFAGRSVPAAGLGLSKIDYPNSNAWTVLESETTP